MMRENGSLTCHETGSVTAYAIDSVQQRGRLFVKPGEAVYEDQVGGRGDGCRVVGTEAGGAGKP